MTEKKDQSVPEDQTKSEEGTSEEFNNFKNALRGILNLNQKQVKEIEKKTPYEPENENEKSN